MLINNNESIFQPYSFKYHLEKKENVQTAELEEVPVLDEYRRLDIRSEAVQASRIMFSRLPIDAFTNSSDEISSKTIRDLLINGSNSTWTLGEPANNKIVLSNNISGSAITMVHYPYSNRDENMVVIHSSYGENTFLSFWSDEKPYPEILSSVAMGDWFPDLKNADFFDQETVEQEVPKYYWIDEDNYINIKPYIHMNPNFEGIKTQRYVQLKWIGSTFEKKIFLLD
jgi:hypothetical protein